MARLNAIERVEKKTSTTAAYLFPYPIYMGENYADHPPVADYQHHCSGIVFQRSRATQTVRFGVDRTASPIRLKT